MPQTLRKKQQSVERKRTDMMHFEVLSLFPRYIEGPLQESILKRAIMKGLIQVTTRDIRSFSIRKDGRVDDRPYGGGPGMVMMAEPVVSAIEASKKEKSTVVYLTPRGQLLTPQLARQLSTLDHLILVCGHYEGIDERAIEGNVDYEISIGDYVLTNGCLASLVLIDAVSRFIPGVLGHEEGSSYDSFEKGLLECPHYTTPRDFQGKKVPEVLFSGDHKKIASWRNGEALRLTMERRPELMAKLFAPGVAKCDGVSLEKIVEPTTHLEKTCAFYRKLTGASPEIDEGKACFSFAGTSLGFVTTNDEVRSLRMLYLALPVDQFRKAFLWWSKECGEAVERLGEAAFFCTDPDGRSVVVRSS